MIWKRKLAYYIFCLFVCNTFYVCSDASGKEMIRVAILKGQESIKVSGSDISIMDCVSGKKLAFGSNGSVLIEKGENGLIVNKLPISSSCISISDSDGIIDVNKRGFRGKVEIMRETKGGLLIINELNLEDYLVGLISQEISTGWDMEVLKVQAVVARTYALFKKASKKDNLYCLESTVIDQVYNGSDYEDLRSQLAVKNTEGEVITTQGEVIQSVYHSCCGGKTEPATLIWQNGSPLLRSITCRFCADYPHYFWELKLSCEEIEKRLNAEGYKIEKVKDVTVIKRSETNRVMELSIRGKDTNIVLKGNELRRILGFDRLRSTNFVIKTRHGLLQFLGIGYGHGSGLCQWGARKMAENGYTYREILHYYYPFAEIKKIY